MFCLDEAIHNTFSHNVSYDDLGGTISPSLNPDALLSHNIFYVREGVPFVRNQMGGGGRKPNYCVEIRAVKQKENEKIFDRRIT